MTQSPFGQITFERVDNHWREKPAFKELEFRLACEESTRLALVLSGEAHIADLPRELQKDALKRGLKLVTSSFPVDWMTVYLGGQYYLPGDPAFKPDVPWTKKKVRQALNMAINRKELLNPDLGKDVIDASCTDDPSISPNPPPAEFDTHTGSGSGRYNGIASATAEWTFTDAGETGTGDTARIIIRDASGTIVLEVSGSLRRGNDQAHN